MLGCLYGQAIGDALGLGTEFMDKENVMLAYPQSLTRYDQIIQDAHRRRWHKGAWTDDTDMMLCILDAYDPAKGRFNLHKIASNFKAWSETDPPGIGSHISKVLYMRDYVEKPEECSRLWWHLSGYQSAANGALMRTSAVGLLSNADDVIRQAEEICRLTHFDPRCVGSCVIASLIIHHLVWNGRQLSYEEIQEIGERYDERIAEFVDLAHRSDDISQLRLDDHHSIGYTLRTLSAALWCLWHVSSFEEGLLAVVNEGGDADTNAAVACAILGAKFGCFSIPVYYIDNLYDKTAYDSHILNFINLI